MDEGNRGWGGVVAWILIFILLFAPDFAYMFEDTDLNLNPFDYARIVDVDYRGVVVDEPDSQGKMVVTERLTFDVHAASRDNGYWELWRDLVEDYVDGVKVYYKVNSVKQILPDGTEVVWEQSPKLYWEDYDYVSSTYGPGKWYHSQGPYNEDLRQYECLMFYIDDVYREKMTFEIEYEMYNAVLRYNDCSDLYAALYSGKTIKHLESFDAEILIPDKDMPREGNYKFTTYGTNAETFPFEESKTKNPGYHTFSFSLSEKDLKFKPYNQYIEFDLVSYGEDKHIFAENASKNIYSETNCLDELLDEQSKYENMGDNWAITKGCILLGSLLASAIVFFIANNKVKKYRNQCPVSKTKYDTYRDIPSDLDPKFAAALVFSKDKKEESDGSVYSAILLSLARKGYIELNEKGPNDMKITFTNKEEGDDVFDSLDMFDAFDPREPLEPLTASEQHYFDLLKHHKPGISNSMTMSDFQRRVSMDYMDTNSFIGKMERVVTNEGIGLGYFKKADYKEPKTVLLKMAKTILIIGIVEAILLNIICSFTRIGLAFGAFFLFGFACIAISLYLRSEGKKYVYFTEQGEEEYQKWRGLYNFLKSDTLINERTVVELPIWEKYLVYATAFGISEKVIKAINLRCKMTELESPMTQKSIVYNTYCRTGRIHTHGRTFHTSVRSSSRNYARAHRSSGGYGHSGGGYGGGFGFGGGGRGGGGGGGGH